jgi:hypothetical protein
MRWGPLITFSDSGAGRFRQQDSRTFGQITLSTKSSSYRTSLARDRLSSEGDMDKVRAAASILAVGLLASVPMSAQGSAWSDLKAALSQKARLPINAPVTNAPVSYEEITLQNYSPFQLELNIDGTYGCSASANAAWFPSKGRSWVGAPPPRCTARVVMADHTITVINASADNRQVIKTRSIAATPSYTDSECYGDFWFDNPSASCP